jgi:peptidoglycan/xylan/chitin deacetylase (PgdA/CDA1 family)
MRSERLPARGEIADDGDAVARVPRWVRPLLGWLSPGGGGGRLTTLIFHRVHAEPDPLFPSEMCANTFRERVRWIREWFNVLPLQEAVAALAGGSLPERALAITFDDGYADNFTVALPILRDHGVPAAFFVAAGFLDGGRMWNDTVIESIRRTSRPSLDLSVLNLGTHPLGSTTARRAAIDALIRTLKYVEPVGRQERVDAIASLADAQLPDDLMMTSAQVRGLAAAGMEIGGHTLSHPILARIDVPAAHREIMEGREALESMTGRPVRFFAYPNGRPVQDYGAEHVTIVRNLGFTAAVSTAPGAARAGDSLFELPRFTPWDASAGRWGLRLARNLIMRPMRAAA